MTIPRGDEATSHVEELTLTSLKVFHLLINCIHFCVQDTPLWPQTDAETVNPYHACCFNHRCMPNCIDESSISIDPLKTSFKGSMVFMEAIYTPCRQGSQIKYMGSF